ncbi:beta-ketoacyl synthase N-terminal-like domain-containing protein [Nocardia sp. NPDC127579]|uniref:beta-ketoacyl synthase N-terminal-like domain-containing protein n=1 Tax=Nocardia sp. NPDC127579 TaxID=3345402 RepID=UPI003629D089
MSAVAERTSVVVALGRCRPPSPDAEGWFNPRTELGRGYRHLPDAAHYLLAAARQVAPLLDRPAGDRWGVSIGSAFGSARLHDDIERSVADGQAHLLSPTAAPYFAHNMVASQLSAEYGITGMCLSVHTPGTAGLDAIGLATSALDAARVSRAIVGGFEAPRREAAPGERAEGAMVLVLAADAALTADTPALARITVRTYARGELERVVRGLDSAVPTVYTAVDDRTGADLRKLVPDDADLTVTSNSLAALWPLPDMIESGETAGTVVAVAGSVVVATVKPIHA